MFAGESFDSDNIEYRRLKYLRVIYAVCSIIILFFILRYNFEYSLSQYNSVIVPAFVLLLITPFIFYKTKSYNMAAGWTLALSSFILAFFLLTAGGIQAPGIFWLTSIPITGGILFGRRGGLISALGMVAIFLLFYIFERRLHIPNIVADRGIYKQEKFINIVCFLSYSLLTTYYFIKKEDEASREVLAHKQEIENFLRILIHDVANPAQFISFGIEQIRSEDLDPSERDIILLRLERNIENIISILQQVRQFKALKDGKIQMDLSRANVNKIIESIIDIQTPLIKNKSLKINFTSQNGDVPVLADAIILHNVVLSNLINNAIKFSARGGVIDIHTMKEEGHLMIRIQDYGIGIPKSLLIKLFNVNASTSRDGTLGEKGTGYGMPLAREYIERMNGTITVVSRENAGLAEPRGTTITITLPLAKA